LARLIGDVQPWLEGDLRKVVRRYANKRIGKALGRGAFGDGAWGALAQGLGLFALKSLFGLNRR
jgi:hypothetical protein